MSKENQWFIDRIGKTIYVSKIGDSEVFQGMYKYGLHIENEFDANYIGGSLMDFRMDDKSIRWFDSIEERDEYERRLTTVQTRDIKR